MLSAALPAFLASLVEFVEALTIVLAVGATRGWRAASTGAAAGVALLAVLVVAFGPALERVPLARLQIVVGIMLLFFGLRWLRKAVLRYAGAIAMHDEAKIFARERDELRSAGGPSGVAAGGFDWTATGTAFNAVVLEGLEVIFIVIAVGATAGQLLPASIGAVLAGVLVVGAGFVLRAPLARVPENSLKFVVGVMLSAFGTFWTSEGFGFTWPREDLSLLALIAGYLAVAGLSLTVAKRLRAVSTRALR
jgi:uncharacterized membrane protein